MMYYKNCGWNKNGLVDFLKYYIIPHTFDNDQYGPVMFH